MGPDNPEQRALSAFRERFERAPAWAAQAPGRVNLIGEHTDYNGGFVLPMAIDRRCVAVAAPAADPSISRIWTADLDREWTIDLRGPIIATDQNTDLAKNEVARGSPLSYVAGVADLFRRRMEIFPNLDIAIASSVPLGGGLSSSASLEVATATLIEEVVCKPLSPLDKARLCQEAEHEFAGVPCGLMDQLASVLGREGHAMLIDCRSSQCTQVPLWPAAAATLTVIDSGVRHALAAGEYAKRRSACEAAAQKLGVPDLRAAAAADQRRWGGLTDEECRCVRHVTTEIARVDAAVAALRSGNLQELGQAMSASHASLRDDYRVSCPELDGIVAVAQCVPGVFGARMTGAGFGGCAIVLSVPDAEPALRAAFPAGVRRFFTAHASNGAGSLPL
jgi:galactokinase